jgi:hypothetical protein
VANIPANAVHGREAAPGFFVGEANQGALKLVARKAQLDDEGVWHMHHSRRIVG